MPITILPVAPAGVVGPGLPLSLSTDFIGPIPTGSVWNITFSTDPEGVNVIWGQAFPANLPQFTAFPVTDQGGSIDIGQFMVSDGTDIRVIAQLEQPGGVAIDSGAITAPLNTQQGLANALHLKNTTGQGLTDAQAQQLEQVSQSVVPVTSMDQMGLSILTVPGGQSDLQVGLSGPVLGVIVRIDQIPDQLVPIAGDPDYWRQTLAQVSIYRSDDLWLRFPVHTQSRIFNLPGSELAAGVAALPGGAWLLNMHLVLTTFPGVLATVMIMTLP